MVRSISAFRPLSPAAQGSVYLLTHRSWTSRIGTGFKKWRFSRPCRLETTSPAPSRSLRCFMTPKRVMAKRASSSVSVCPSCRKSSSSNSLRVGSASALNTGSMERGYVPQRVTCQGVPVDIGGIPSARFGDRRPRRHRRRVGDDRRVATRVRRPVGRPVGRPTRMIPDPALPFGDDVRRQGGARMSALMLLASNGGTYVGGLLGFVLWVVILVWIYNIARRKGRHTLGWLVLGFFFSLLTLIVILLLPSKRTTDKVS